MLEKSEIRKRINFLVNLDNGRLGKYYRNYRLYTGNPTADLNSMNPAVAGYQASNFSQNLKDDTPRINVVKSCIDAVVSKVSQARCRPYINTANGSFKDIQIAKNLQTFLDIYCDDQRFNYKVASAFRDACTFDVGYMYFDPDQVEWLRVFPWNTYIDPNEVTGAGSKLTQAFIYFPNYPVNQLSDELYAKLPKTMRSKTHIEYGIYYDTKTETKAIVFGSDIAIIEKGYEEVPLVSLYYTEPVIGNSPMSITDMIFGIQQQIDILSKKITEASRLSVAGTYFVPKALGVPVSLLNNRIGNIIPVNTDSMDIQNFNPQFINPQYQELMNDLIERAYNMVGISQLSAQGKKTEGLDSGVALATMEDIQSDRFESQLRQYVDTFTKMVKIMIEVMGAGKYANEPITDNNRYTMRLTWKEVKEEIQKLRLMFSSADSLSKDPSEKLKQLQQLAQAGLIPSSHIGQLLELPDIQTGFNLTSNAINAVSTIINKCIYEDNFNIPDFIPISMLKEEIINTQLLLQCAQGETDSNEEDIAKLQQLWEIALSIEDENMETEEGNPEETEDMEQSEDEAVDVQQAVQDVSENTNGINPKDATLPRNDISKTAQDPPQMADVPQN